MFAAILVIGATVVAMRRTRPSTGSRVGHGSSAETGVEPVLSVDVSSPQATRLETSPTPTTKGTIRGILAMTSEYDARKSCGGQFVDEQT
jgi:hypothetical protein